MCPASCPSRFTPRKAAPGTLCIRGRVGPRVSLDVMEKKKSFALPRIEPQLLNRPAFSIVFILSNEGFPIKGILKTNKIVASRRYKTQLWQIYPNSSVTQNKVDSFLYCTIDFYLEIIDVS
jgi:hypothetical protein